MRETSVRYGRCGGSMVEPLEGRVLLSSAWAGTWTLAMSTTGVESHRWGVGTYAESKTLKLKITDTSSGRYHISVPAVKFEADLVDDPAYPGSGLKADVFGPDNEDPEEYTEMYMRLQMTDPGVIFVAVQDVGYDSDSMDRISWSGANGGIATKRSVAVTTLPWEGTYPVHSYDVEGSLGYSGGTRLRTDSSQVLIAPAGRNRYTAGDVGGSSPHTFTVAGSKLKYATAAPAKLPDGTEYESEMVFRGPYGRLYHVGISANCDGGSINNVSLDASWTDPITQIAPALDTSGLPFMMAIAEDATGNSGTRVSDLLSSGGGNYVYDANDADSPGIAVTGTDMKHGTWQFSTDGSIWLPVGKVSGSSALLLAPDARLRLQPKADFNGTLSKAITFRAWDQTGATAGMSGSHAAVTASGKVSPFSSTTDTAGLVVTPVNDAPVLSGGGVALAYVAGGRPISIFKGMSLADADSKMLTSVTVAFAGGYAPGTDTITYRMPSGITITPTDTGGVHTLTIVSTMGGAMKISSFVAALKSITFNTPAQHADVTISFQIVDEDAARLLNQTATVDRLLTIA